MNTKQKSEWNEAQSTVISEQLLAAAKLQLQFLAAVDRNRWLYQGPVCNLQVRYKSDCEEVYGRILDNFNVVSSVQEISRNETEQIWNKLYPNEPYDIEFSLTIELSKKVSDGEKHTKYDLVLAVERQYPFFYQVSRPHVNNDQFLEAAVARYKGFLHLIKRNKE